MKPDTSAEAVEVVLAALAEATAEGAGPLAQQCEDLIRALAAERDALAGERGMSAWDGRPQNPERDGWHWLCAAVGIGAPYPMLWSEDGKAWDTGDGWVFCTDPALTERRRYLGPCHTPAEVAALVEAAGREAVEACVKYLTGVAERCDHVGCSESYSTRGQFVRSLIDQHVRALTPPAPNLDAMLAEAEKRGYRQGWDDREGDLLAGCDRVFGAAPEAPGRGDKP